MQAKTPQLATQVATDDRTLTLPSPRVFSTVLVLDLSADGHHPRYMRWVIGAAASVGSEVVVAGTPALLQHGELATCRHHFSAHEVALSAREQRTLSDMGSTRSLARRQFLVWSIWRRTCQQVIQSTRVDAVLLAWADDCLEAIGLRGSPFAETPWTGIVLRPMFHFRHIGVRAPLPRFAKARQAIFRRALRNRNLVRLLTIDPTLNDYVQTEFSEVERRKLAFLPDPSVDHHLPARTAAREVLGIPSDAAVILVYGAVSARKGIGELIRAAADAECPRTIHLLIAGRQAEEAKTMLQNDISRRLGCDGRLHLLNGYQDDTMEATLLAAADCMWVGYRGFYGMSGVLVLAARHGLPCIVSDYGVAGYYARQHRFGILVEPDDPASVLAALQRVAGQAEDLLAAGRVSKTVFERHSLMTFERIVGETVGSAMERVTP